MVELKEKKKFKDDDKFKPVPNPNYKPSVNKASFVERVDPLQNFIPNEKDNIYRNSASSSISSCNSNTSKNDANNTGLPRATTPKVSIEQVVQPIRAKESNSINIQVEKPKIIDAQVEKPKAATTQTKIPKKNILQDDLIKNDTSQTKKPTVVVKTPRPSSTFRISPLYAMTPQAASTTISRRASTLSRRSSTIVPPPLPSTPRPSTAPLMLNAENDNEKKKMEERWTISSSRKLEKLPVRVSNPKLNNRNSHLFSTKPLPAPPKHIAFRTSSGFENLACTTNFYQPSLAKRPSWISDQSFKLNQSQQNERALELTQNK